jgi:type I site-specific restriction endonuclease
MWIGQEEDQPPRKYYVNGKTVQVLAERVEYLDDNGKLVTDSLRDYSKKALRQRYISLNEFLQQWNTAERKQAIVEELEKEGVLLEPLAEDVGKNLDPLISSVTSLLTNRHSPAATVWKMYVSVISSPNMARKPRPCLTHCCKNTRIRARQS